MRPDLSLGLLLRARLGVLQVPARSSAMSWPLAFAPARLRWRRWSGARQEALEQRLLPLLHQVLVHEDPLGPRGQLTNVRS
jgi:hypothetical protein